LCRTRVGCHGCLKSVLGSAMVAQAQFPRDRRSRRFMEVGSLTDSEWQQSTEHAWDAAFVADGEEGKRGRGEKGPS
jgi:hypothetical protein